MPALPGSPAGTPEEDERLPAKTEGTPAVGTRQLAAVGSRRTVHAGSWTVHAEKQTFHAGWPIDHAGRRAVHEGAPTDHAGSSTVHAGSWTVHESAWTVHEGAVTDHAGWPTDHAGSWQARTPFLTIRTRTVQNLFVELRLNLNK